MPRHIPLKSQRYLVLFGLLLISCVLHTTFCEWQYKTTFLYPPSPGIFSSNFENLILGYVPGRPLLGKGGGGGGSAFGGGQQIAHELVVWHVLVKGGVQPLSDLFAPAIDETCSPVGVAKHVRPEGHPMFRISFVVFEQAIDQALVFVRFGVVDKGLNLSGRGQDAEKIQPHATNKSAIVGGFIRNVNLVFFPIGADQPIDGIRVVITGWKLNLTRRKWSSPPVRETESLWPGHALIDPRTQQADLFGA